jgi:uncharacterized protein involved in exopolysaccharide biosynthesis
LLVLVEILTQWWKFIVGSVLFCGIASIVAAFIIPPQFKSVTTVFPSQPADLFGASEGVSGLVKSLTPRGIPGLSANTELDRYVAILKSGHVISDVINKFDLVKVYDITSYPGEKTAKRLMDNTEFVQEPEGDLTITVFDEDPQRAADMANFFVEDLNRTNTELLSQNARGNRVFIEERYSKNLQDIAASQESLRVFQKRYGVIALPQQTEATIKAGAEIAAQLALKEVQLSVARRTLSEDNPAVQQIRIEMEELRRKITEMNRTEGGTQGEMKIFVPFASIPDLGSAYLHLFREQEMQYKILQFIAPLYEQAKVEERRQTPSVIVLDKAYPAERKSRPKRAPIVLGGMLVGLVGSLGFIAVTRRWRMEKERDTRLYHAMGQLLAVLRSDLRRPFGRSPR